MASVAAQVRRDRFGLHHRHRLGSDEHQKVMSLDEAVAMMEAEAVAPDLRRD